jgi:hypothetical protein
MDHIGNCANANFLSVASGGGVLEMGQSDRDQLREVGFSGTVRRRPDSIPLPAEN